MKKIMALFAVVALLLTGCFADVVEEVDRESSINDIQPDVVTDETKDAEQPVMSLEDKLWQLFYVTVEDISGNEADTEITEEFSEKADKYKVGGVIIFEKNAQEKVQLMKLLADLAISFDTPVFLGVDEEGGRVSRLSANCEVTDNGNMSDIEGIAQARAVGERLGRELSGLGFNMDFAPVADVLVNPNNTEIGKRSFGSDAVTVAEHVAAEVSGMQGRGISSVLKHFPGHGSAVTNSHNGVSVSERTLDQLREEELLPFISGIEAGAEFVMVSHLSFPEVLGDNTPASLSPVIITDLLRGELGYQGIVITDALNMGAVTEMYEPGEAAVLAIEAGADMLLMPEDLDAAYEALMAAVESGRITEKRIDESISRILSLKKKMGLIR